MRVGEKGEFGLIADLRRWLDTEAGGLIRGVGDDAAVFEAREGRRFAYTADAMVEGVHFDPAYTPWHALGYKALAVNLSDLAAMGGGGPSYALVVLGLREDIEVEALEEVYRGMRDCGAGFACAVVGGDIVASPERTFISVSLVGVLAGNGFLARDGARPGQVVAVTGTLGDSILGLKALMSGGGNDNHCARRHLYPEPRMREGRAALEAGASAAIDVSDGLLRDLGHVCEESGVGARVLVEDIPISPEARRVAKDMGADPVEAAVAGGEDYELVVVADGEVMERLAATCALRVIGEIVPGEGVELVDRDGRRVAVGGSGYEHFKEAGG